MRPRAAGVLERRATEDLNEEDQAALVGLAGVARNQAKKRMEHNATAVERGSHFIIDGSEVGDVMGQLACRDCDAIGRWSEWKCLARGKC